MKEDIFSIAHRHWVLQNDRLQDIPHVISVTLALSETFLILFLHVISGEKSPLF